MTLNALALELIRAHKENSGDANYVATVEQWIRDGLDEIALETDWRAFVDVTTLVTAIGTRVYTLPSLVRDVRLFRDPPTETNIEFITKERLADLGLDLEQTGRPNFFYFEEQDVSTPADIRYKIGFQPVPDAIYTLDAAYNLTVANVASGSHIPVLSDYLVPLKLCARSYMYDDDRNLDSSDRMYQRFKEKITMLKGRENNKFANRARLQQRDIPGRGADRRLARLDPNHFS